MLSSLLNCISKIVAIIILLYLSFEDIRYREVSVYPFLIAIIVCSLLTLIGYKPSGFELILSIIENIVVAIILLVLVLIRLKGLGDLLAFIVVIASSPFLEDRFCVFTPSFTTLFYYVLLFLVLAIGNLMYVLVKHPAEVRLLRGYEKIVFPLIARPILVKDLIEGKKKWWFPIKICGKRSLFLDVNVELEDIINEVKSAIKRGCIHSTEKIWATYGYPALPLITVAYIIALLIGDKLLVELVARILGVTPLCVG